MSETKGTLFHICKMSRNYEGRPYQGPTSDNKPAEAETFEEAVSMAEEMVKYNPVGWDVYNAHTGECVWRAR